MPPIRKSDVKEILDKGIADARLKQRRARSPISKGREAGREQAFQEARLDILGETLPKE